LHPLSNGLLWYIVWEWDVGESTGWVLDLWWNGAADES
jgi:hypothetical protein